MIHRQHGAGHKDANGTSREKNETQTKSTPDNVAQDMRQTSTDATSPIEIHAKHHEVEISLDVLAVARMLCQTSMDRHKGDVNTVQETPGSYSKA